MGVFFSKKEPHTAWPSFSQVIPNKKKSFREDQSRNRKKTTRQHYPWVQILIYLAQAQPQTTHHQSPSKNRETQQGKPWSAKEKPQHLMTRMSTPTWKGYVTCGDYLWKSKPNGLTEACYYSRLPYKARQSRPGLLYLDQKRFYKIVWKVIKIGVSFIADLVLHLTFACCVPVRKLAIFRWIINILDRTVTCSQLCSASYWL